MFASALVDRAKAVVRVGGEAQMNFDKEQRKTTTEYSSLFDCRYLPLYTTLQILPFTLSVMYIVPSGPTYVPLGRAAASAGVFNGSTPLNPSANTSCGPAFFPLTTG